VDVRDGLLMLAPGLVLMLLLLEMEIEEPTGILD
jgi:hypothetical protein